MGFFLVFFPEEEEEGLVNNTNIKKKKPTPLFSSSSSKPIITTVNTLLRRTNSTHLLSKAQSTISICVLLVFLSLLLFTLSTFEPTTTSHFVITPRRQLSSNYKHSPWPPKIKISQISISRALQGMGKLYRRGTEAMNDLIICHVMESVTANEFRLFLRLLLRSSLTSKSDVLFLFPSTNSSISFDSTIRQENDSFFKLITNYKKSKVSAASVNSTASFDMTQFVKQSKKEKERAEPIWGRKIRSNYSGEDGTGLTRMNYGSVVGFEVDELDPENSLAGFLDNVPMSLRRWACYPMLLGRVRRNFKHVMLVDLKEVFVLSDPLGRVRTRSPESVFLSTFATPPSKQGKKNSDKTQSPHKKLVYPSIIMGGTRGIRRLSSAMATEIARTAMQHKRKNSLSETGILSQLAEIEFISKNIKLVISTDLTADLNSLSSGSSSSSLSTHSVVRRGNSNINLLFATIMKHICSFPLDFTVYGDC